MTTNAARNRNTPFRGSLYSVRSSTHPTLTGIPPHLSACGHNRRSFCILLRTRIRFINHPHPHYASLQRVTAIRSSAKLLVQFVPLQKTQLRCCCKRNSTVPMRTSSAVLIGIRAGRPEVRTPEGKTFILKIVYLGFGVHPASCPLDIMDFFSRR